MYTDIFLDFDDTIYDTRGNAQLALLEIFDHFGLGRYFDSAEDFTVPFWQTNDRLWEQYARGEIGRDHLIVERMREPLSHGRMDDGSPLSATPEQCLHISDVYLDYCATKPGLVDGARQLMDHLRDRGYRMHMCSNGFHEVQYRKLRSCGLTDYFDTIILSEDAGANKPSRQFFDHAFVKSGACPATTIMVGDNPQTDIGGATDYGLDTIWFNRKGVAADVKSTHTVSTLREIMTIL